MRQPVDRGGSVGAVLVGGASRRMGSDKAKVEIGGRTMLERVVDALLPAVDRAIIVGAETGVDGVPALRDLRSERLGPLAGLEVALQYAGESPVVLVAVDQPWLRTDTLRRLLDVNHGDAIVPVDSGFRQPTCAVYSHTCLPHVFELLSSETNSLQALLERIRVTEIGLEEWSAWGEDGRSWFSADDPDAIARGTAMWGDS